MINAFNCFNDSLIIRLMNRFNDTRHKLYVYLFYFNYKHYSLIACALNQL